MKWQPIAALTDKDMEDTGHLLLANSCNGPFKPGPDDSEAYMTAQEIRQEGCWDWFAIIPDVPDISHRL